MWPAVVGQERRPAAKLIVAATNKRRRVAEIFSSPSIWRRLCCTVRDVRIREVRSAKIICGRIYVRPFGMQLSSWVGRFQHVSISVLNPLTGTFKPQIKGPLCSNTVIGILAVNGLLRLAQQGGVRAGCAQSSPSCTKCDSPPINSQCT